MAGPIRPGAVSAQALPPLDCGVNGLCLSDDLTNLLGLPNGTLNIISYHPWDQILQPPAAGKPLATQWRAAAAAWGPLEVDARAGLAALHGVPNDFRLPHAADDDLRAQIFMRLLTLAKKRSDGVTLTDAERDALDAFSDLIVARRVLAAQKAVDEYARWQADPCQYTVPVASNGASFGFDQYEPGPQCGVGGVMLAGPPRPPTAAQFKSYGAALALQDFANADMDATLRNTDEALAIGVAVVGAVAVGGLATIAAVASPVVAFTFAAMAGSFAVTGTLPSTAAIGAAASAGAVGVGVAAALPAIVIISAVVAVVYIIQFVEDQSVLPTLQESLNSARTAPNIWSMVSDTVTYGELLTTALIPMSPSYATERAASTPTAPTQRGLGDPRFEVNGQLQDFIETWTPDSKLQQTFMSQGWFVTRTRTQASPEAWGPWNWSLTLKYVAGTLSSSSPRTAGIQPSGFLNINSNVRPATVTRTTELFTLSRGLQSQTVKWAGNHPPTLAPTVSEQPKVASPVTFHAGASDSDQGDSIVGIRWYFEDPTFAPLKSSFDECSFTPPGKIDPVSQFPYGCPWKLVGDSGTGVTYTYARPGTWGVMVMARDSQGGVASQQFTVTIGNLAPTLAVTSPPPVAPTLEGQTVTIGGTVNYPGLPDGTYGTLTALVVEWGDGQTTTRGYPCDVIFSAPSDRHCVFESPLGAASFVYAPYPGDPPLPAGPWSFTLSHAYAYSPDSPFPDPAQMKVYAVTDLGGRSPTQRFNVSITNVPPTFEAAPVCPLVQAGPFGILCIGGDIREAGVGQPLTIRGRLFDLPAANHFVKVTWGDGTSSAYPAGCSDPGCPGHADPWPGATTPPTGYPPKYLSLSHTYQTVGTYPINVEIDDGGPGGHLSYSTQAVAFGVSDLAGPAQVQAGSPATYTYTSTLPANATITATPTCEGGDVSASTASSFTCAFPDVAATIASHVKLHAVIASTTFDRSMDIGIQPRPVSLSTLGGPTTVIAGTSATFTYTTTVSPYATVTYSPACDVLGNVTASTDGSSFTCHFSDVPGSQAQASVVRVDARDSNGNNAHSALAVAVIPDLTPPALTLPATIQVNSTSNAGASVSFSASAVDLVSGPAAVTCSAQSGAQFPMGATTVSCWASDWRGNRADGSFQVVVADATPPSLSLPPSQVLDATGPAGAVATFLATATDASPASPPVSCSPASGSTFPIGTTTVTCSATDAAGNRASGQLTITVRGPLEQIAALENYVTAISTDVTVKNGLIAALRNATSAVAADRPSACAHLATIVKMATRPRGSSLTADQINRIVSEVARIQRILGC